MFEKWESQFMRCIGTKLPIKDAAAFEKLCAQNGTSRYEALAGAILTATRSGEIPQAWLNSIRQERLSRAETYAQDIAKGIRPA